MADIALSFADMWSISKSLYVEHRKTIKKMYQLRIKATRVVLEEFGNPEDAFDALNAAEQKDIKDGVYEEDTYEVVKNIKSNI